MTSLQYSAVIFDLDGTVLVNEEVYAKAFADVLRKYLPAGRQVVLTDINHAHPQIPGVGLQVNWEMLKEKYELPAEVSVAQLVHQTQDAYHARLDEVKIRPGFWQLHAALRKEGLQLALATSNDWWLVDDELEDLGLDKLFDATVTGEEVANRKPAPDIFAKVAEKLSVEAGECLVIEDSPAGIEAAKRAGMVAVAIVGYAARRDELSRADWIVESFDQITPQLLDSLFGEVGEVSDV